MTLTIEAGKYYRTRDGRKVGPMRRGTGASGYWNAPSGQLGEAMAKWFQCGSYWPDGHEFRDERTMGYDIIAAWHGELPYGHIRLTSGTIIDLTGITTPFGLLDADTKEVMRAHGGPYEIYTRAGWNNFTQWVINDIPVGFCASSVYRVKPKPVTTTETADLAGKTVAVDKVDGVADWATFRVVEGVE